MPIQRYKLTVAYRGTRYHGWQQQSANPFYKGPPPLPGHGIPTVQEALARAIVTVVHHPVIVVGASRTDSGVHAKGQVAHFDTDKGQIPPEGMRRAINHRLPEDILVRRIEPVPESFNAILSTVRKRYQYLVWNAFDRPLFCADLAFHRWQPLDTEAMIAATRYFVGEHDFTSFSRPECVRYSMVRTVYNCTLSRRGPRLVFGIEGSGFLWNMVRIMVGTLVEVGLGRFRPDSIPAMLEARDRRAAGSTAPAQGLYLQWVITNENGATRPAPADETGLDAPIPREPPE